MAIPGFQEFTLPLLRVMSDQAEHRLRDLVEALCDDLGLDASERKEMLPSGQQAVVHNRVGWARTYLLKAGLLNSTRRGYVKITDTGKELLKQAPSRISVAFLRENYPEIKEFIGRPDNPVDPPEPVLPVPDATPEEQLEQAYQQMRGDLATQLLEQVMELSPRQFERLVVELLVKMGYGGTLKDAGRAVGESGDGGIDGIIKEDRLGLDTIYLQAKRYTDQAVGRPAIQGFVGALQGVRARKGVFITTSRFASTAVDYTNSIDVKVVLIDGQQLADYMIDFDLGVTRMNTFEVKRIDSDYFDLS